MYEIFQFVMRIRNMNPKHNRGDNGHLSSLLRFIISIFNDNELFTPHFIVYRLIIAGP